jgi:hypothetical protein
LKTHSHEKIVESVLERIESRLVVNKPHLIHIIQNIASDTSRKETNEIIKRLVIERKIDEYVALSKKERPYSFYTLAGRKNDLSDIISQLMKILDKKKELSVSDATRLTGYPPLIVRTLLTHLLLEGILDYHGTMDSPIFFVPWDL